jgi:Flp pilus assembly protein TadG
MMNVWAITAAATRRVCAGLFIGPLLRRFVRHDKGATAIEFSLVALPFLALLFAIIETAMVFFAGQVLETAAANASRLILTGQATTQGMSAEKFKNAVCTQLPALFDCAGGVYVDVKTYTSFADIENASPVKDGKLDTSSMSYKPGGPSEIVVMKLYYEWPIYVSLLNTGVTNLSGGKRLLVATSAFRNEPFQ